MSAVSSINGSPVTPLDASVLDVFPSVGGFLDWIANAATGTLTDSQVRELKGQMNTDMQRAGGTPQQIATANTEFDRFIEKYEGGTIPLDAAKQALANAATAFGAIAHEITDLASAHPGAMIAVVLVIVGCVLFILVRR